MHLRRGGDNSLLDPASEHDNLTSSSSSSSSSSSYHRDDDHNQSTTTIVFEETTQHIIEIIGQLEGFSASSIQHTLTNCMNCIPSQYIRLYILNHLLDILTKTSKLATLKALASTLDDKQQNELATILTGLPPSVLGDLVAKETTRVLVDLLADTKECSQIDKLRVAPHKKFVDTTVEMLQQTLSPLPVVERENVVLGILQSQPPALKMKLTLKYIVLSRCLQPDRAARVEFMQQLLNSTVSLSV